MRRYGLDWLRIAVVLLLFPFHTARIFDRWEPNYVKDVENAFSTWFVAGVGFWFMALLFVIAGFSTFYALQKRTARAYIKERTLRLLVPFLIGLVLIVPVQGYLASLQHEGYAGNYLQFLRGYFTDFGDLSGYTGSFTPAHLWFILFLYAISVCLLPILLPLRDPKKGRASAWLLWIAFIPMSLAEALPDIGGKNPFFFGLLFFFGFLLARSEETMALLRRIRFYTLGAAAILSPLFLALAYRLGWPDDIDLLGAGIALFRNLCVWLIVLALMGLADAGLNRPSRALSYLNAASYPVYLLHQSVLIAVAYFAVQTALPPAVKFLTILSGTLLGCAALYEALRRTPPTRLILGIKAPAGRKF